MKILAAKVTPEQKLATEIEKARIAYYRGRPTMTDAEYDKLEDRLRDLAPDHPVLKHSGAAVPTKMKVRLPYRMPSLTKHKYRTGAVSTWLAANPGPYVVSWKIDGISALKVDSGNADEGFQGARLYTRGRSGDNEGGDITFLLPTLKLPRGKSRGAVRGELVMENRKFDSKWAADFVNPRNLAGGITNRKSVHDAVADLDFLAYELLEPRLKPSAAFAKLKSMGYHVAPFKVFPALDETKLLKLLQAARANGKYEVDGLVISVDKKTPLSSNDPTHTFAFKSDTEDDSATTTVEDIEWNITRTNYYFPRVIVKPVRLKGVTVTYASAKSAEFVKANGIGPGAVIKLRRSGDVIPDIRAEDVIKKGKLKWPKSYEWHGANIRPPKGETVHEDVTVMRLTHFFVTLGIEQFKAATVAKYVEEGFDTPRKILRMSEAQFTSVEGVSKTARVVYSQVQALKTKGVELHLLMYASGLFGRSLGSRKLGAIVNSHPNILDRVETKPAQLIKLVDEIPGFDVKQATAFVNGLPKFVKFAAALGLPWYGPRKVKTKSTKLKGVAALFTGFRDKELEELIIVNGGTIASTIKSATVLIAKDPGASGGKLDGARALGTRILTAQQFRTKYGI